MRQGSSFYGGIYNSFYNNIKKIYSERSLGPAPVITFDDSNKNLEIQQLKISIYPNQSVLNNSNPTNLHSMTGWTGAMIYHSGEDTSNPNEYTMEWESEAGTIYAGTIDAINGILTVTHSYMEFNGTETWVLYGGSGTVYFCTPTNVLSSNYGMTWSSHFTRTLLDSTNNNIGITTFGSVNRIGIRPGSDIANTVNEVKTWLANQANAGTPVQVVFPLRVPITYELTPIQIETFLGENNIWSNVGDTILKYKIQ